MRITGLFAGLAALVLAVTPVAANPGDQHGGPPPWAQNDRQRPDWNRDGPNQSGNGTANRPPWWQNGNSNTNSNSNSNTNSNDNGDSDDNGNDNRPPWWDNDDGDDWANNDNNGPYWQQGGWGFWGRRGIFQNRGDGLSDEQADALSDAFQDCVASDELRELRRGQLWTLISTIGLTEYDRQHIRSRSDLSDALSEQLDSSDVQDLRVVQILRVARACGLSIWDVLAIIHEV